MLAPTKEGEGDIFVDNLDGPIFGSGSGHGDLRIASNAHFDAKSSFGLEPKSCAHYALPAGQDSTFLTGDKPNKYGKVRFRVEEWEVWRVRDPEVEAQMKSKLVEGEGFAASGDQVIAIATFEAGLALSGPLTGDIAARLVEARTMAMTAHALQVSATFELFNQPSAVIGTQAWADCLTRWLEEPQMELLYRASRDGWVATDFHRCCDGQGATLVVVRDTEGNVFGGYADRPWGSNGWTHGSPKAFVFSLVGPSGAGPTRMALKDREDGNAVFHRSDYGPCFGYDDLKIASNAHASKTSSDLSSTNLSGKYGSRYALPTGQDSTFLTGGKPDKYFGGAVFFTVGEWEVWRVR